MKTHRYDLPKTTIKELVPILQRALASDYAEVEVEVTKCPDLRNAPFHLAGAGLGGTPIVADIGGQPNLFPTPKTDKRYSMIDIAQNQMNMSAAQGMIIGAGAGPFHVLGQNSELAPNFAWQGSFDKVDNQTRYTKVVDGRTPYCGNSESTDCALMMNLFGSEGRRDPVLRVRVKTSKAKNKSFTENIRHALYKHFGNQHPVSLGGTFVFRGKVNFHIMPGFPPEEDLPFKDPKQLNDWLTYHDFAVQGGGDEIVCLSVLHSADPEKKMGLRMEHTHCFSMDDRGGHYHHDLEGEQAEYEGYFNVAETIYRVDRPEVTLERDLHD